jgi:hypothetical protein
MPSHVPGHATMNVAAVYPSSGQEGSEEMAPSMRAGQDLHGANAIHNVHGATMCHDLMQATAPSGPWAMQIPANSAGPWLRKPSQAYLDMPEAVPRVKGVMRMSSRIGFLDSTDVGMLRDSALSIDWRDFPPAMPCEGGPDAVSRHMLDPGALQSPMLNPHGCFDSGPMHASYLAASAGGGGVGQSVMCMGGLGSQCMGMGMLGSGSNSYNNGHMLGGSPIISHANSMLMNNSANVMPGSGSGMLSNGGSSMMVGGNAMLANTAGMLSSSNNTMLGSSGSMMSSSGNSMLGSNASMIQGSSNAMMANASSMMGASTGMLPGGHGMLSHNNSSILGGMMVMPGSSPPGSSSMSGYIAGLTLREGMSQQMLASGMQSWDPVCKSPGFYSENVLKGFWGQVNSPGQQIGMHGGMLPQIEEEPAGRSAFHGIHSFDHAVGSEFALGGANSSNSNQNVGLSTGVAEFPAMNMSQGVGMGSAASMSAGGMAMNPAMGMMNNGMALSAGVSMNTGMPMNPGVGMNSGAGLSTGGAMSPGVNTSATANMGASTGLSTSMGMGPNVSVSMMPPNSAPFTGWDMQSVPAGVRMTPEGDASQNLAAVTQSLMGARRVPSDSSDSKPTYTGLRRASSDADAAVVALSGARRKSAEMDSSEVSFAMHRKSLESESFETLSGARRKSAEIEVTETLAGTRRKSLEGSSESQSRARRKSTDADTAQWKPGIEPASGLAGGWDTVQRIPSVETMQCIQRARAAWAEMDAAHGMFGMRRQSAVEPLQSVPAALSLWDNTDHKLVGFGRAATLDDTRT